MTTEATSTPRPLKLFYCYARADKAYRDELDNHLSSLKRSHQIASWSDREISPGVEWETAIDKELNTAHIILLLVSVSFMASDYAYGIEMKRALERHRTGEARVVPILLRAVDWEDAPFSKLQVLPSDAKPISRWHDRDDAFEDIAKGLRKVVKELQILLKTKEELLEEGNTLYSLQRYDEAIRAFDQAIRLDPNYASAHYNKGNSLGNLQRYDEAIRAFDQAIRLDPNYAAAYYNKGNSLHNLQRYDEAISAFDQAIRLNPNDPSAYYNKGVALQHLRRNNEADTAFKKAKELGLSE
jgi:tetratricopeptide (TPR) repeat protein